ncbi:MAG: hypothetical protein PVJ57_03340 [Phycisphaerae bacterium]|jgi:hypothetical protein
MVDEESPVCGCCGYILSTQYRQAVEDQAETLRCSECGEVHHRKALAQDLPLHFEAERRFGAIFRRMWWSLVVPRRTYRHVQHWYTSTRSAPRHNALFALALAAWYFVCMLGYALVGLLDRATIDPDCWLFSERRFAPWSRETAAQAWTDLKDSFAAGMPLRMLGLLLLFFIALLLVPRLVMFLSPRRTRNKWLQVIRRAVLLFQPVFLAFPVYLTATLIEVIVEWRRGIGDAIRWSSCLLLLIVAWTFCRGAAMAFVDGNKSGSAALLGGFLAAFTVGICQFVAMSAFWS